MKNFTVNLSGLLIHEWSLITVKYVVLVQRKFE